MRVDAAVPGRHFFFFSFFSRICESLIPAERQLSPENESESGRSKEYQSGHSNCWINLIPHALF